MYFPLKRLVIACVGLLFLTPFTLGAQTPQDIFEPAVELSMSPETPGRNTDVTVSIFTNAFNTNSAFIVWILNGEFISEGVGDKTFTFNTGELQEEIVVQAIIQTEDLQNPITKTITFTPAEVDIIWEAQGYTPPFYKGKSHPVFQSRIIFTALPSIVQNGGIIPPEDLVYTWSKGDTVFFDQSGFGRNVMIYTPDFLSRPFTLKVEARTQDGAVSAVKAVGINPSAPELVFYEEKPLEGVLLENGFTNGSNISMTGEEIWIKAVPYFTDINAYQNDNQVFKWTMNNTDISDSNFGDKIILRRPAGVERGIVNINAEIENGNPLQILTDGFSIIIDRLSNTTSLF